MRNLVLKDILIQKKIFLFGIGFTLFILIAFQNPVFASFAYLMSVVGTFYQLIQGACIYDDRNKSEVILNSLPLKRADVVKGKYLSMLVFAFFAILIAVGLGALLKSAGLAVSRYMGAAEIVGAFLIVILMGSLCLPVFFKFGAIKARIYNMILFMAFFFAPNLLVGYMQGYFTRAEMNQIILRLYHQPEWLIALLTTGIILVLLLVSLLLSMRFYGKREF